MRLLATLTVITGLASAGAAAPPPDIGGGGAAIPPASDAAPTADAPTWGPPNGGAAPAGAADSLSPDAVAQGRYLAAAGDCAACHTKIGGAAYAGGRPINTPFGAIFSANITPHRATGIGDWSADEFYRAMHNGVGHGGKRLYPAFPYPYFTRLSRADSDAMFAYLRTVPAVAQVSPANRLPFPLNIRFLMRIWNAMFFKPRTFVDDPTRSAEWNRGAYLVQGPGHCGACHTPKNFLAADRKGRNLQGARLDNWAAVNLTGDASDGLGSWSRADIVEFLRTGRNARAAAAGSMSEVVYYSTSRMSDADLAAMATYLKDAAPSGRQAPATAPDAATIRIGEAIYVDNCSACHRSDGRGVSRLFPPLVGDTVAQSPDPTTIARLILTGARSIPTPGAPTPLAMPPYGAKLSDAQIAAVATYVRNSWGNAAPTVAASQVARLRHRLTR